VVKPLSSDDSYEDSNLKLTAATDIPSAEDLAISKLDRLSETDVLDILALMNSPGASWDKLSALTKEVETYYPAPAGSLTSKLNYVKNHRG
jgi:hypothetical protein